MTDDNDFWGNQAEWPDVPEDSRRAPRPHTGAVVSSWWNRIVGGGAEGTRQHRRLGATSGDGFRANDDHAQDDWDSDDFAPMPHEPIAERGPERHAAAAATSRSEPADRAADVDETWDEEWVVESDPTPSPGVDPLLARLGGLAIVTTLLVPLALGLRSHDDSSTAVDTTSAAITLVAPIDTSVPIAVAAPTPAPDAASAASSAPVAPDPQPPTPTTSTPAPSVSEPDVAAPNGAESSTAQLNTAQLNTAEPTTEELATPAVADEVADREQSCAIDYDVVAGDFWIRLAKAAGVPLDEILDANDATVNTPLFPGSTICLPAGASVPAPPPTAPAATTPATIPATTAPATTIPATTAAPTTTAKPVVTYPTISAAAAAQIIRDVWPDELEARAIEIATRESTLVVTARNSCCYGLFQINWEPHKAWLAGLGVTSPEQLFDGATNARAAYTLYQRAGGWGPWT